MSNPIAMPRNVQDGEQTYGALMVVCPGCQEDGGSGLHMLPVGGAVGKPNWTWNGSLDSPTLDPSILTKTGPDGSFVCHSYLRNGVWEFLEDCTHSMAGQHVPAPPLPDWVIR